MNTICYFWVIANQHNPYAKTISLGDGLQGWCASPANLVMTWVGGWVVPLIGTYSVETQAPPPIPSLQDLFLQPISSILNASNRQL